MHYFGGAAQPCARQARSVCELGWRVESAASALTHLAPPWDRYSSGIQKIFDPDTSLSDNGFFDAVL